VNVHAPAIGRRRFLRILGQGTLCVTLPASILAAEADVVTVSILHTTDLHGHILPTFDYSGRPDLGGLARCVTQIRQWQRENLNFVLIDVGDVFQGTELGLQTRGAGMIRCLNALNYDAWVVGNHEFDWGMGPFSESVALSAMPVLSGNALIEGKAGDGHGSSKLSKIRPFVIKEVAGFKIAVVGLTTPGLATWLPPEKMTGFEVLDPIDSLRKILGEVRSQKPDAILLAGHMGLTHRDDYANRVDALTREFPELVAFLGGHTHQNHPSEIVNNVLYTQADHFGIYVGKVDLIFDRASRRLLKREAVTVQMDSKFAPDPLVLSISRADLDAADQVLAQKIGELTERFDVIRSLGQPSDVERLIGSAAIAALQKQGLQVDAVVHGLFDSKHPLLPGTKVVSDVWDVLPYENEIVTVDLNRDDFLALARDFVSGKEFRCLMGVQVVGSKPGAEFQVQDLRALDGSPLPAKPTYRIAMNAYDSQSGGQRFLTVARLVAHPSNHRVLHSIQTRDALVDFFLARQKVGKNSLLV
jgi:2',3'-cyclic-nucleotide 2'-phosphodiesterase/3'-nucleotidase